MAAKGRVSEQKSVRTEAEKKKFQESHDDYLIRTILHCPFCGHPYDGHTVILGRRPPSHYMIKCYVCNAQVVHDREDKVIGHWNRRSNEAKDPEKIDKN